MLIRTLTDKALLITASKVRYKKANTKFLAKFIFICSAKKSRFEKFRSGELL